MNFKFIFTRYNSKNNKYNYKYKIKYKTDIKKEEEKYVDVEYDDRDTSYRKA